MKTGITLGAFITAVLFLLQGCVKNDMLQTAEDAALQASKTKANQVQGIVPADGTYKITNATSLSVNRVMEVSGMSPDDGGKVQQWDWFPNNGQKWTITQVSGDEYKIINVNSGKALDVPFASTTPGVQLIQWPYTGASTQLWKIVFQGLGVYRITNKYNGLALALENNSPTNGAKIIQDVIKDDAQYWLLEDVSPPAPDDVPPVDNTTPTLTITWDGVPRKVSHDIAFAEYGRVHRISGNTLLLSYNCGPVGNTWGTVAVRRSTDNGNTWSVPQLFPPISGYYGFSNPETFVLQNGWIILAYVGRGNPDDNEHDNVQIRISKDGGLSWGASQIVAKGRSWEPALIQLPTGELELFYSSEAAWWPSGNVLQEIRMVRSYDNGANWTHSQRVAFTDGNRDGMPVPLILKDNKGMIFTIESVNNSQSPWILWSSMAANWRYAGPGTTQNQRRWAVTSQLWGGGPYVIQLPSGQTILSAHVAGGRPVSDWRKNTMAVLAGNTVAKNFTNVSYPWPGLPVTEGAILNGLFLKDNNIIVAVSTRTFSDGHGEIYRKEGHINY